MIRPFANGTQYMDWENANCCRCKKYAPDASRCDLMHALGIAYVLDGLISDDVAARIGYDFGRYSWMCSEVDWTDEWMQQVNAQSGAHDSAEQDD